MERTQAPLNFLSSESWDPRRKYDVVVLGIPDSSMSLAHSQAHAGPNLIRRMSSTFSMPDATRSGHGWIDERTGARVGSGLAWADAGNVILSRERFVEDRAGIANVVEDLRETARLVVFLLGDDSLTYEVFRRAEGALVHCDAHHDRAPLREGPAHHANFVTHLAATPSLEIGQVGMRGYASAPRLALPNCSRLITGADVVEWLGRQRQTKEVSLAVDVDVLDPALVSQVTCPLPCGWSYQELHELVRVIVSDRSVPMISLSEFAPDPSSRRAQTEALSLAWWLLETVDCVLG